VNVNNARKMASVIWGDSSFLADSPMQIQELSVASGDITGHVPPCLTLAGNLMVRDRLHSKILAHQVMQLFDEEGQRTLETEKDFFTWTSADGRDTACDGATMVALILSQTKPHYHVDM
jgi:hypothetical protein